MALSSYNRINTYCQQSFIIMILVVQEVLSIYSDTLEYSIDNPSRTYSTKKMESITLTLYLRVVSHSRMFRLPHFAHSYVSPSRDFCTFFMHLNGFRKHNIRTSNSFFSLKLELAKLYFSNRHVAITTTTL